MLLPLNVFQYDSKCATLPQEISPFQTTSFAGKEYSLKPIDEKTPILFQWFEAKPERYKKDDVPILNTKEHPYLNNIICTSKIESERIIGILVDGDFTSEQKNAFSKLESSHQNIKVIYRKDVDFSMYDKKLSDIYFENIHEQESYPVKKRDNYLLDLLKEELKNIPEEKDSLIQSYADRRDHTWFDFFRNLSLLKASSLFTETGKAGCHNLSPSGGCIYLDADMVLTGKLGVIHVPDGIAVHVTRCGDNISLENGAIAVNTNNHPALLAGLEIMHNKVDAHPYYDGVGKGLKQHFNYSSLQSYNDFCNFIEFKHQNIIFNTSQYTSSSW
ncbi:non-LEE encoded effector protein NleB [Escherichia fergusonii]|uniref:non-LEE encoded effector protein NleB n=1 Tax=Escherichia fergusonii TaxID=564 RepID=UPI001ED638CA|nr:non-LEE encoded effector protein NleB [Escherichia fergusonii]EHJ4135837.1 non-LEE encoded effector protein NleB [Escherichia fergusonii]